MLSLTATAAAVTTASDSKTECKGARFVSVSVSPPMENVAIDEPLREFEGVSVGCWLREGAPLQLAMETLLRDERLRQFWEIN